MAAALPAGSRIVQSETGRIKYRTGLGYAPVTGVADDLADPMRKGAAKVLDGRLPTGGRRGGGQPVDRPPGARGGRPASS